METAPGRRLWPGLTDKDNDRCAWLQPEKGNVV